MMQKRENIQFLSTARVIGILLVVLGHSYPFNVNVPYVLDVLREFIYSFHMPLFVCISGYLAYRPYKVDVADYIKRRTVKLIVPYIVLSLLAYVPKVLFQSFLNDSAEFSMMYLVKSELIPRENIWGHFWYIPVIFFFGCLSILLNKLFAKNNKVIGIILLVSLCISFIPELTDWFAIEDVKEYLFYYIFGMALSYMRIKDNELIKKMSLLGFPISIVLFLITSNEYLAIVIACSMILFTFAIGMLWNSRNSCLGSIIEKNSYTIYLLSWPAQAVVEVVFNKMFHLPVITVMAAMFISGVTMPLVCAFIINKINERVNVKWIQVIFGM